MKLFDRAGRYAGQNGLGLAATPKIRPPPGVMSALARLSFGPDLALRFAQPFLAALRWPAELPDQ